MCTFRDWIASPVNLLPYLLLLLSCLFCLLLDLPLVVDALKVGVCLRLPQVRVGGRRRQPGEVPQHLAAETRSHRGALVQSGVRVDLEKEGPSDARVTNFIFQAL